MRPRLCRGRDPPLGKAHAPRRGQCRHRSNFLLSFRTTTDRTVCRGQWRRRSQFGGNLMTEATKTYEVGFGRPSRHTRFKAGQSGNPKGKPKKAVSLATDVQNELAERIGIREGDRNLKVSKQRALVKALLARALKGDTRAAGLVLQLVAKLIDPNTQTAPEFAAELELDDVAIIERYLRDKAAN